MNRSVCFIGAGNVATHLSKSLQKEGFCIKQIYSRTTESAAALAKQLKTGYTNEIDEIDTSAELFIIALKDSVIDNVLSKIDFRNKLVIHCSGSLPLSVLNNYSANRAVLYPLQTFSKEREIDFKTVPVFVESNSKENEREVLAIAQSISNSVSVIDSAKRKQLHISAVFACNFVNHFYTISSAILARNNISFDVLKPLILETAQKVQNISPENAQTGPAVRFDENIISSHLKELTGLENYAEIYNLISKSIFEHQKK